MKAVSDEFKLRKNAQLVRPIFLYDIEYDKVASRWLYYTSWPTRITFDGVQYTPYVINHGNINETLSGKINKLTLTIGNVNKTLQYYLDHYDGLKECKVIITMVFYEELDNPACYDRQAYFVEQSSSNKKIATLTLGSDLDVLNVTLPRRKFFRTYCLFKFGDDDCGYVGSETTCNRSLQRCEELNNVSRFGNFPAIPMKENK